MLQPFQYNALLDLEWELAWRGYYTLYYLDYYIAPPTVTEGLRPQSRQDVLYARGRTTPGPVVTGVRVSKHTLGRAFDLDFIGWQPNRVPQSWWDAAGWLGEYFGLTWGGRWKLGDFRHFEL